MAAAPLIFTAISTAATAVGALRQGKSEQQSADYNAAVATRNAKIHRQQASQQAAQIERRNRLRIGTIRAKVGASGGTMEGSAIDVLGDVVAQGELERQNAIYQGEIQAIGREDTATLETQRGKQARSAGYLKAGSALLSGASQGHRQYQDTYGKPRHD